MGEPAQIFGSRGEVADPDLAPVDTVSPLEELRAELTAPVEGADVVLAVPGRPGYAVRYSSSFTYEQLTAWRKRATDRNEVNEIRFAALILANQSRAIVRNGDEVVDAGAPLTFRSKAFLALYEVDRVADAVVAFYGNDFDVAAAGNSLLRAAGFGAEAPTVDEDEESGPTKP